MRNPAQTVRLPRDDDSRAVLAANWWAVVLRGCAALIVGAVALLWPGVTLIALTILLSAYLLVDGALAIVASVRAARRSGRWWPFILEGGIGIVAGAMVILWPGLTILALMYLLAVWTIFSGVVMVAGSLRFEDVLPRLLLALAGALSIVLGVLMIGQPAAGVLVVAWWLGAYAVAFGALLVSLGFWLRRVRSHARS